MSSNQEIRDRIAQNDVTVARSYLEIDVMEWFSHNHIPFGYEAFTIPSVVGPTQSEWSDMVDAIRFVGQRDFDAFDEMTEGTRWEDMRPAELLAMWEDIFDKHRLQSEDIVVEVRRSLSNFSKKLILPDFALYPSLDRKTVGPDFDWSSWEFLVEVSGLWGVGLPGEATESDWWNWYRVSAVAFKELVYKLLGLWDDVYWVLPNQPFIEGISDGIPRTLRDDDHYVIINTTSSDLDLDKLADRIGLTAEVIDLGLSPNIELVSYSRKVNRSDLRNIDEEDIDEELPTRAAVDYRRLIEENNGFPTTVEVPTSELPSSLTRLLLNLEGIEWEYESVNFENVDNNENTVVISEDFVVHHGELGDVYITDESVHVRETQWRHQSMIMLREYLADVVSQLSDDGIIEGLRQV